MLNRRLLRIKTLQILYGFFCAERGSLPAAAKDLQRSIGRYFDLLHLLALLPGAMVHVAQRRIELAQRKFLPTPSERLPNLRFVENATIAAIEANEPLRTYAEGHSLGWSNMQETVGALLDQLEQTSLYMAYMDAPTTDWAHGRSLVQELVSWLSDQDDLHRQLEEISAFWCTDWDTALEALYERIGQLEPNSNPSLALLEQGETHEQREFASRLLEMCVLQHERTIKTIEPHLHNWKSERIATMDMLILEMATVESINFPDIPWRVTINEYIELARLFSTPGSPAFVNGVLDSLIQHLTTEGVIKKKGRGLQGENS